MTTTARSRGRSPTKSSPRPANSSSRQRNPTERLLALATGSRLDALQRDLAYIDLVGMIDPPRKEVIGSIAECARSGIITAMITGDHKDTAFVIAKKLGIAERQDQAISGVEIDALSDYIGVAMRITGTDVAKGAADMVLTDDNFKTIIGVIKEGRLIYEHIKKGDIFSPFVQRRRNPGYLHRHHARDRPR